MSLKCKCPIITLRCKLGVVTNKHIWDHFTWEVFLIPPDPHCSSPTGHIHMQFIFFYFHTLWISSSSPPALSVSPSSPLPPTFDFSRLNWCEAGVSCPPPPLASSLHPQKSPGGSQPEASPAPSSSSSSSSTSLCGSAWRQAEPFRKIIIAIKGRFPNKMISLALIGCQVSFKPPLSHLCSISVFGFWVFGIFLSKNSSEYSSSSSSLADEMSE